MDARTRGQGARVASGDGWTSCAQGHRHWGRHGAAGLLLVAPALAGAPAAVLLQLRVRWSHHGGTWGLPGGARHRREDAAAAALRECGEEVDVDLAAVRVVGELLDDHGGWAYTTVVASAPSRLPAAPDGWESDAVDWVPAPEVPGRLLHPGLALTWPRLAPLLPQGGG